MHSLITRFRTAAFGSPFSLTSPGLLVALASLFFLPTVNGDQRGRFNFTIPVAVPDTYDLRFRIYGEHGQATRLAYKYAIDRNGRYSGLTAATADESGE